MSTQHNICLTCNGSGLILSFYDRPGGPPGNGYVKCPTCLGTGKAHDTSSKELSSTVGVEAGLVWTKDESRFVQGESAEAFGFDYMIFPAGCVILNLEGKELFTQVCVYPKHLCESHHAAISAALREKDEDIKRLEEDVEEGNQIIERKNASIEQLRGLVKELRQAMDPFVRVYKMNEPLAANWPDDMSARECFPGLWPTWGDLKALATAAGITGKEA